jgi:Holliday junction resolvase RusA-like endonuclease
VSKHFALKILQNRPKPFKWFELTVLHNTRLDMDNVTGIIKPCVDVMRKQKIINDDNKKNWDCLVIKYDQTLPKNTVRFELVGEGLNNNKTK